jgi:hypothetical protein
VVLASGVTRPIGRVGLTIVHGRVAIPLVIVVVDSDVDTALGDQVVTRLAGVRGQRCRHGCWCGRMYCRGLRRSCRRELRWHRRWDHDAIGRPHTSLRPFSSRAFAAHVEVAPGLILARRAHRTTGLCSRLRDTSECTSYAHSTAARVVLAHRTIHTRGGLDGCEAPVYALRARQRLVRVTVRAGGARNAARGGPVGVKVPAGSARHSRAVCGRCRRVPRRIRCRDYLAFGLANNCVSRPLAQLAFHAHRPFLRVLELAGGTMQARACPCLTDCARVA